MKGLKLMKEWFSEHKKTIYFVCLVCLVLALCAWLTVSIIDGTIGGFLASVVSILAPVLIGFIIAYLSNPVVSFFEHSIFKKLKKPTLKRALSIIVTFVIFLLVLSFLVVQLIPNFISAASSLWNTYIVDYENSVRSLVSYANNFISSMSFLESWIDPLDADLIISWIEEQIDALKHLEVNTQPESTSPNILSIFSNESIWSAVGYIFSVGTSIINGIKNFFLGLFISFYMLMAKDKIKAHLRRLLNAFFAPKKVRSVIRFGKLLDNTFGGFIEGQLIDAVVVGVISYFAFLIFDIPSPYVLAIIISVTNVIPILGPFIGGIPCAFIVFLINPPKTILFVILIIIIQQIDGNIICPKILGDKINISSLSVIISIVIMGGLFGIPGMFLGVPCFAVAIHLIQHSVLNKLRNKGMETSLEQYYIGDAEDIIDNTDKSQKLVVRAYNACAKLLKRFWVFICKPFKKKKADALTEDPAKENEDNVEVANEENKEDQEK